MPEELAAQLCSDFTCYVFIYFVHRKPSEAMPVFAFFCIDGRMVRNTFLLHPRDA